MELVEGHPEQSQQIALCQVLNNYAIPRVTRKICFPLHFKTQPRPWKGT